MNTDIGKKEKKMTDQATQPQETSRTLFNIFNRYQGNRLVKVVSDAGELQPGDSTCYPDSRDWKRVMAVERAKAQWIIRDYHLYLTTNNQMVVFRAAPDVAGLYWHDGGWFIVKLTRPTPVPAE